MDVAVRRGSCVPPPTEEAEDTRGEGGGGDDDLVSRINVPQVLIPDICGVCSDAAVAVAAAAAEFACCN